MKLLLSIFPNLHLLFDSQYRTIQDESLVRMKALHFGKVNTFAHHQEGVCHA